MFDTVRLILYGKRLAVKAGSNNGRVEIKAHGNYLPYHTDATSQGYLASNLKKIYHPDKEKSAMGIYFIKVDESQPRGRDVRINLEFSIPKFLLGSNLYELDLSEQQYQQFRQRLYDHLKDVVVDLKIEDIDQAVVARLDISKNVVFPADQFSINWFIDTLTTYNVGHRFKLNQKTFQNDKRIGKIVTFHNKQQGIKFYNKLEELLNHDSHLLGEAGLVKQAQNSSSHVLRIERSLQNYNGVCYELKKHIEGKVRRFTIREAWDREMAQKLLIEILDTITEGNLDIFNGQNNAGDILELENLLKKNSYAKACQIYVTQKLLGQVGQAGFESLLKGKVSGQTVKNYVKNSYEVRPTDSKQTISSIWAGIYQQIKTGELITIHNWEELLIRHDRH